MRTISRPTSLLTGVVSPAVVPSDYQTLIQRSLLKNRKMKIKNKGKVHPATDPILSNLQLLPSAILALTCLLPVQDIQVLSYLIARSLQNATTPPPSVAYSSSSHRSSSSSFGCDCFDCYPVYWTRWDSSPNRDLIHRVIDAFEEHLSSSSSSSSSSSDAGKSKVGRRRGKDRNGGRDKRERSEMSSRGEVGDVGGGGAPEARDCVVAEREKGGCEEDAKEVLVEDTSPAIPLPASPPPASVCSNRGGGDHKGLARKVLPDVLGILNSRLWNLWSPDV